MLLTNDFQLVSQSTRVIEANKMTAYLQLWLKKGERDYATMRDEVLYEVRYTGTGVSGWWYDYPYSTNYGIKIDGTNVATGNLTQGKIYTRTDYVKASGAFWINHSDAWNGNVTLTSYLFNSSYTTPSANIELDTIRTFDFGVSLNTASLMTLKINYQSSVVIRKIEYTVNGVTTAVSKSTATGNFTINGLSPNTAYQITIKAYPEADNVSYYRSVTTTYSTLEWTAPVLSIDDVSRGLMNPDFIVDIVGTTARVSYSWNIDNRNGNTYRSTVNLSLLLDGASVATATQTITAFSGTQVCYFNDVAIANQYSVTVEIADSVARVTANAVIPRATIPFSLYDDKSGNVGLTVGRSAVQKDVHVYTDAYFHGAVYGAGSAPTLLWENDSPTTAHTSLSVPIPNMSDYSMFIVFYNYSTSTNTTSSVIALNHMLMSQCVPNMSGWGFFLYGNDFSTTNLTRVCRITDSSLEFGQARSNATSNNAFLQPIRVYGIK